MHGASSTTRGISSGRRLSTAIILSGGPRPAPIVADTGHSVLDLSVSPTRTVLGVWIERLSELAPTVGPPVKVRVVSDDRHPDPVMVCDPGPLELALVRERRNYRGPAGTTKDETAALGPGEQILVVEAARLPLCSLVRLLEQHVESGADVTVAGNPDGSTAGLYMLRRSSLDLVPGNGFMDLKEQWLSRAVGAKLDVRVYQCPSPGVLPLRTREHFLEAVRVLNNLPDPWQSVIQTADAREPEGPACRSVLAESATVASGAVVVDSIVMENATIAPGAIVLRSLVCPRAVVGPDVEVVDGVVGRGAIG